MNTAAVSCSPVPYRLGGVGFGFWLTGKLGRAWVGAWHGVWVHGCMARQGVINGLCQILGISEVCDQNGCHICRMRI